MKAPNQLSFLPDDYLERKAQRRTNAICATLFLVVMVMIGTAFTFTERSMRAVERDHADVERQYTEAARRIQQVQQMQDKQRTMAIQAELKDFQVQVQAPRSLAGLPPQVWNDGLAQFTAAGRSGVVFPSRVIQTSGASRDWRAPVEYTSVPPRENAT